MISPRVLQFSALALLVLFGWTGCSDQSSSTSEDSSTEKALEESSPERTNGAPETPSNDTTEEERENSTADETGTGKEEEAPEDPTLVDIQPPEALPDPDRSPLNGESTEVGERRKLLLEISGYGRGRASLIQTLRETHPEVRETRGKIDELGVRIDPQVEADAEYDRLTKELNRLQNKKRYLGGGLMGDSRYVRNRSTPSEYNRRGTSL